MDRYLSPQPPSFPTHADSQQKSHRDSTVDQFFSDDHTAAPYTLNMNLYLPDVAYPRMGSCEQARPPQHQNHAGLVQIKTETASSCFSPNLQRHCPISTSRCGTSGHGPGSVAMETSAINMTLTGLPDFTSVFNQSGGGRGDDSLPDVFIKQEMSSPYEQHGLHHDGSGSLFQLLNSGLDHHPSNGMEARQQQHNSTTIHTPFHDLPVAPSSSSAQQEQSAKAPYCSLSGGVYTRPHSQSHPHFLQQQVPYLPPSPPNSEPGSPDRQKELLHTMSPPPSYAATIASKLAGATPGLGPGPGPGGFALPVSTGPTPVHGPAAVLPQVSTATATQNPMPVRYNRRNNPDLEKRRIHHCDYPG